MFWDGVFAVCKDEMSGCLTTKCSRSIPEYDVYITEQKKDKRIGGYRVKLKHLNQLMPGMKSRRKSTNMGCWISMDSLSKRT